MIDNFDKYTGLGNLIFSSLNGNVSDEELSLLQKVLSEDSEALTYYQCYLTVYVGLRYEGILDSYSFQQSHLNQYQRFLKALAEYEKNAETVEGNGGKGQKRLSKEECEELIKAFVEEEKRIKEEERVLEEEQARAKMQQLRRIRMKKVRQRERIIKLKRAAGKTWKFTKITAAAAFVAFFAYIGYLLIQPVPVATLTDSANAEWEKPNFSDELESRLLPGPMKLTKGLAQITFDDGAEVIIEAPSTISLEKSNQAFLELGRLSAIVPKKHRVLRLIPLRPRLLIWERNLGLKLQRTAPVICMCLKGWWMFWPGIKKGSQTEKNKPSGRALQNAFLKTIRIFGIFHLRGPLSFPRYPHLMSGLSEIAILWFTGDLIRIQWIWMIFTASVMSGLKESVRIWVMEKKTMP